MMKTIAELSLQIQNLFQVFEETDYGQQYQAAPALLPGGHLKTTEGNFELWGEPSQHWSVRDMLTVFWEGGYALLDTPWFDLLQLSR